MSFRLKLIIPVAFCYFYNFVDMYLPLSREAAVYAAKAVKTTKTSLMLFQILLEISLVCLLFDVLKTVLVFRM